MIIVIVVVGAVGYFAFNKSGNSGTSTTPSQVKTCVPVSNPICSTLTVSNDVSLLIPFASARTGNLVPITASVPGSDGVVSSYQFFFGDGTNATSTSQTVNHAYTYPGNYIVYALATINGQKHDSYYDLGVVSISAASTSSNAAEQPGVSGAILANTTSQAGATAILQPGQSVTVSGAYTSQPTNPDFTYESPTIVSSGTLSGASNTSSSATATVSFASSSTNDKSTVTFVGKALGTDGSVVYQNFTWTVFVAPSGIHAGTQALGGASSSPHSGSLVIYELAPGGSTSEDPAVDYETVGYEPILNIYQTLIAYNGSDTGPTFASYVPVIAACVPGSDTGANNCNQLFGSTLINGSDYTFVISGSAQFYDPTTQASWGVYPTDVLFSIARTMGFAVEPCFGCNNGWIVTQALLSSGNGSWDGGLHGARNNTPSNVYNAITLNESGYCTAQMMAAPYHGCVTFHANGNGLNWPYFLELIGDPLGGSIVPCGWFSANAQAAGIPYWTEGNSSGSGDHPCAAPGQGGYGVASPPAKGWDSWEKNGASPPFVGNVQWNMVGSGPYYMNLLNIAQSYSLKANPAYTGNPLCTWTGCWPQAKQYAGTVTVTWETTQLPGETAYQNGVADFASIPSTDTGLLLQMVQQGKIKTLGFPGISIDFMPFNFAFNVANAKHYTTNPITVSSDLFSYDGLRQFVVHSYPYATIQSTINTKDGIQYDFNYGGAIPQFMANYYPTNVSWPSGDPDSNPNDAGGAAWWWAQITSSTSPFYDPELASCTSSNPCQFPLFGETGAPDLDQRINLWASEINSLSGGALRANPLDINFVDLVINSLYSGPYQNAMPLYRLGWAPDYPDPTDYMVPLYYPDSSYTASDTVWEQTQLTQFNDSSCHPWSDWTWYSNYVAANHGFPTNCQGAAYSAMNLGMKLAAVMPAGAARVLAYNEVENIANGLALYAYTFQTSLVASYANWINGATINTNVTIGGGNDQTWFTIQGAGVISS